MTECLPRPTRIACAALRIEDGRVISLPRPARHHDVIAHMVASGFRPGEIHTAEQGFTTDTMPFVRRSPARRIAEKAGQLIKEPIHTQLLFSEDMW